MTARILLLGGVTEALAIARRLGPQHVYSLAGIGRVPQDLQCQVRVGGYGGAEGLAATCARRYHPADRRHPPLCRADQPQRRQRCRSAGIPAGPCRPAWQAQGG
jgi:precorrin-6A/cobalt-precorrin-6A reductase